ncbi:hypothetical protein V6N13_069355 [Hibiscus sabdariffa]
MALFLCLLLFLLSSSSASACDRCLHQSKAAYFSKASALSAGACGYGSLALGLTGGHLAAGVSSLYKDGAGCGACFQIRCKNPTLCSSAGTRVTLTDLNHNNQTDFVLSSRAFRAMAKKGKDQDILKLGIVDVEYKRIPCEYKNQNLAVRVEESSQKPNYLAIKLLYQGGQTEVVAMDIAQVGSSNWNFMSRNHGAVWDTSRVPNGALQFRFVVTAGFDGKWIWAKSVLPADWKTGVVYDSGVQITDIAKEGCSPCDDSHWSTGRRKCYRDAAAELAHELVRGKKIGPCLWRREYWFDDGFGFTGCSSRRKECSWFHRIIPMTLMSKEITGETVGEVRPVANMQQRKAEMARHSDCFIALPGQVGKLSSSNSSFEVLSWPMMMMMIYAFASFGRHKKLENSGFGLVGLACPLLGS